MRTFFVYFVLSIFSLGLDAARLDDPKSIFASMRKFFKPFGCYDLIPGPQLASVNMGCMRKIVQNIMADSSKDKELNIPSVKKIYEEHTQCRMEKLNIIRDGELNIDAYSSLYQSPGFILPNPQELPRLTNKVDTCTEQIKDEISSLPPIEGGLAFESCQMKLIMDECRASDGADSIGSLLPLVYALNSLVSKNENCDSVIESEEVEEEYLTCIDDDDTSSSEEDKKIAMSGSNYNKMMSIMMTIKEIPEIECLIEISEKYGLHKDGKTNFTAVADYIGTLDGWSNEEIKNQVIGKLVECEKNVGSTNWEHDMKVSNCFLPVYADLCGLDNELSRNVLYPALNAEFFSTVLNRIHEKMDLSRFMTFFRI